MSRPITDPERWAKIERLYHAALELKVDQRDSFLREACADEESLRQEVLSLLQFDPPGERFLQGSPLDAALTAGAGSALIGQKLGQYTILSFLDAGGMGEVYRASDSRLGRDVAIKVLPETLARNPEALRRFEREARTIASLNHPNILSIHDFGTDQGIPYAVMELLEGETLANVVKRGPLGWRRTIEIGIAIAEGLAAAHAKRVTHRDLKPANVFITSDGRVKILDFGIARVKPGADDAPTSAVTEPGTVLGTVGYMSPEQVRGEEVEAPSDIFSFGCVLYEMLAARNPFKRGTNAETMAAILKEEPPDLALAGQDIPGSLSAVVGTCLQKNPTERPESASELARLFKALLTDSIAATPTLPARRRSKRFAFLTGLGLLALAAFFAYWLLGPVSAPSGIRSIAVLPFRPLAGPPDETLEFGMADTLILRLSNIRGINVRPITAVRKYAGLEQDAVAAGREQRVDAVLDGHIQKAGKKIRLSVRLVRVADGTPLWTNQFDEEITDIFQVQDSISERVAAVLAVRLTGVEKERLTKHYTDNTEAYQLYLMGRYHLNRLTDDGFLKSLEYFQRAVVLDENFALAHAGVAESYNALGTFSVRPPKDVYPKARSASLTAVKLDDTIAQSHTALAVVNLVYDWDWSSAGREFKRALEINPSDSDAHSQYGFHLASMGQFEEAIAEMRRAQELDPVSPGKITGLAQVLYVARRYDAAIEQCRKALEMDPNLGFAYWLLGLAYTQQRKYEPAILAFQKSIPLSGDSPDEPAALAIAFALSGKPGAARKIMDELMGQSKAKYLSPTVMAALYASLGEKDQAFALLDKAYNERDSLLALLKVEPLFDGLRSDPRFTGVVRRVGLPQ